MTRIRIWIVATALTAVVPVLLAGCGSGGGGSSTGSEDPQQVLNQTFNNDTKVSSGVLDITLDGNASGSQSGNFSATLTGPFQSDPKDPTTFPQLDLTAKVTGESAGQSLNFDGGLTVTSSEAFVTYQGQAYKVPDDVFNSFVTSYKQQAQAAQTSQSSSNAGSVFSQLGIDPSTWLTNVTNEGHVDVAGTDTIHIHGDADVTKIVQDLDKVAKASGASGSQISSANLNALKSSIQNASVDVYSGTDDHLLRKLGVTLTVSSGGNSVDITFEITIGNVNQQQTINAPSSSKPLSDLTNQLGINLGSLGGVGSIPGGSSSSGTGGASSQQAQKYLQCVQSAGQSAAKINDCAKLLQ